MTGKSNAARSSILQPAPCEGQPRGQYTFERIFVLWNVESN